MSNEWKVGDKVIWTGRGGWGRPAPWCVETVIKVTSAGRARISENRPLYNPSGWAVGGDKFASPGSIEPWSEAQEAKLRAADAEYNAAMEFRDICHTLSRNRDNAEAARLLALMPEEYRAAARKESTT
jgi:hypothetical protein